MERDRPVRIRRDRGLWPLLRLLAVAAALGLLAHWRCGWNPPTIHGLEQAAGALCGVLILCAFFSSALAETFLALVCFPLHVAVVLNDWLYCASRFLLRPISGRCSPLLQVGLATAGELGLFVGLWKWAEFLLAP